MLNRYFNSKKTYTNYIKIIRISILLILIILSPITVMAIKSQVEVNDDTAVADESHDISTQMKGLEIYPNHKGSEIEEVTMDTPFETQNDSRNLKMKTANIENVNIEVAAYPAGGPYLGHFTGESTKNLSNLYDTPTATKKTTYISIHSSYSGVVPILGESNNRYKIAISGYIGWIEKSAIKLVKYEQNSHYNFYRKDNGDLIHHVSTNPSKGLYGKNNYGEAPSYFVGDKYYISFDGHYFYEPSVAGFSKLINDYNKGVRTSSINPDDPYYNYFQWLPSRTQSTLTAADLNKYLTDDGKRYTDPKVSRLVQTEQLFINNGHLYGGNHTLAFANAIHESAFGTSAIGKRTNNFFGHAAYDSNPGLANTYDSPDSGIANHYTRFLNWNYLDTNDNTYQGGSVGDKSLGMNVHYASDPYWGEKIASYYYNIDKKSGKKDYKRYTLGVTTSAGVPAYKEARSNSGTPYSIRYAGIPVAILGTHSESTNTWFQFTSDRILDANKDKVKWEPTQKVILTRYNIPKSQLYVNSKNVKIVSQGKDSKLLPQLSPSIPNKPSFEVKEYIGVTTKTTNLYPDWSTTYKPILSIPQNTRITGVKTSNGWFQTQYTHNGNPYIGYVRQSDINFTPAPLPPEGSIKYKVTASDGLRLRDYPESGANLVTMPNGVEVTGGTPLNGWVKVKYLNYTGYASADFLKKIDETVKPPVTDNYHKYDLNKDSEIDIMDMLIIRAFLLKSISQTPEYLKLYDLNGDKTIDIMDMLVIRKYIIDNH